MAIFQTPKELAKKDINDLEKLLESSTYGTMDRNLILEELVRKRLKEISKPHWTVNWGFRVNVITMILAAIAALFGVLMWIQS